MEDKVHQIARSNLSVLSFQIEGLCTALRLIIPQGLRVGKETIAILNKLRDDLYSVSEGKPFEKLPEVTENSETSDVLVFAETLRGTLMSFLTPEEVEEQIKTFGFNSSK